MNQQKKNIRLLITWLVLLAITAFVYFDGGPGDRVTVPRDLFAMADPSAIDRVQLSSKTINNNLVYANATWNINGKYKADPQRITVLFAILKQNKVRRKVAKNKGAYVDSLMAVQGVEVVFFKGDDPVKSFWVTSSEDGTLSYFKKDKGENYVVEIPGYRVNLAGIFELDENGWRDPRVFDVNWANLQEVNMIFPDQAQRQFDVTYDGRSLEVQQLAQSDTAKLADLLDDLSLLYVNDYLNEKEIEDNPGLSAPTKATVIVRDVTGNAYTVAFFEPLGDQQEILGRIDSADYAVFDFNKIRKILRPKNYFELKNP